jgi:uncharacterized protein (UPF0332 family)
VKPAAAALLDKAARAFASAELLLKDGDADGACNPAYYAMFDAARALMIEDGLAVPKTHAGLVAAFGLAFVASGRVEKEIGASLNRVQQVRQIADYTGEGVALEDARLALDAARVFVARVGELECGTGEGVGGGCAVLSRPCCP